MARTQMYRAVGRDFLDLDKAEHWAQIWADRTREPVTLFSVILSGSHGMGRLLSIGTLWNVNPQMGA